MRFEVNRTDADVVELRVWDWKPAAHLVFMSDIHADSIWADLKSLKEDIGRAKELGAFVVGVGDIFDAMQGRYDPRRSTDEILPELQGDDYYDRVVAHVADLLSPVADRLVVLGYGNHETAVREKAGTDLLQRLAQALRQGHGSKVEVGGYDGYLMVSLMEDDGRRVMSRVLVYYHHGSSAGAPVSKGLIEAHRQRNIIADIIVNGHNHRDYVTHDLTETATKRGKRVLGSRVFLRTPGYKAAWLGNQLGFEKRRRHGPRPVGCIEVSLRFDGGPARKSERVRIEPTPWVRAPNRPRGAIRSQMNGGGK